MAYGFATVTDMTWAFFGIVGCLLVTSVALFWSMEEQRVQRRVRRK